MSLKQYIAQKNVMANFMVARGGKVKVYDENNLSADDKAQLADSLACDLSPENLCCDGELRGAPLRAKAKMLNDAKKELAAMGVTHDWW